MALNTKSGKDYEVISTSDPRISVCFRRGFMPLGDSVYIDTHIINASDIGESIAVIQEIDETAADLIENIIDTYKDSFQTDGKLPGQSLQNMATWMIAWSLEMAWCWSRNKLEGCSFSQDMSDFEVPMEQFSLVPNPWANQVVMAFMEWCYNNPGYTDRHGIDIYDPLRDGYLTISRLVVTKTLPFI